MEFFRYMSLFIFLFILVGVVGFIYAASQDWKTEPASMQTLSSKSSVIKTVYFYLVSLIALFMIVFATADLVNLGLKVWVFPKADKPDYIEPPCAISFTRSPDMKEDDYQNQIKSCETNRMSETERRSIQRQRDAVRDLSFLIVGAPLFAYHWRIIRKESREDKDKS